MIWIMAYHAQNSWRSLSIVLWWELIYLRVMKCIMGGWAWVVSVFFWILLPRTFFGIVYWGSRNLLLLNINKLGCLEVEHLISLVWTLDIMNIWKRRCLSMQIHSFNKLSLMRCVHIQTKQVGQNMCRTRKNQSKMFSRHS